MFDLFASFLQDKMVNLLYKILETKKNNDSGLCDMPKTGFKMIVSNGR